MDPFELFKQQQKERWANFVPLEAHTTRPAGRLVRHAGIRAGQRVLDVACGTGVVSVTAARLGAKVTALDLTPQLLERARENAEIAQLDIEWHEGDVEKLPFQDSAFDVVVSQFGHMFAPRPEVALAEMLRVLKAGGTLAFSTWPPELGIGRTFALVSRYSPPPPPGVSPPPLWGDPNVIRQRLGDAVRDIVFDRDVMIVPALSVQHNRAFVEKNAGPIATLVQTLSKTDPEKLAALRRELDAIAGEYFGDNALHQGFLMTRATKL